MSLIPLPKGSGIYLNNAVLYKSLSSHQLIVACIVHHINDTGLADHAFRAPRVVVSIQSQCLELLVSSTGTYSVNTLTSKLRICWWSSKFILSLFSNCCFLTTIEGHSRTMIPGRVNKTYLKAHRGGGGLCRELHRHLKKQQYPYTNET